MNIGDLFAAIRKAFAGKKSANRMRLYESLIRYSRDIVLFIRRSDGKILEVSQAAVKIYGYSRDELLHLTIQDLRASETRGETAGQMEVAGTQGILFETVHRRKDGTTFPVEVSSQGAKVGKRAVLLSIIRDITDRKRAEEKFRAAFANNPAAITIKRVDDGHFLEVNDTWTELMGYSREEALRFSSVELNIWPSAEDRKRFVRELEEKGSLRGWEQEMRTKSGELISVQLSAQVLTVHSEKLVLSTFVDLTQRKRAEQALRDSEERLRAAAMAGEIGMWSWNPGTNAVMVSANWRKLFGVGEGEVVTFQTWQDRLHPEDRENALGELNAASRERRDFNAEYRVLRPDGSVRWIIDRGRAWYDEHGCPSGMAGVNVDITERKQAEEALKEADRRKDEFLAVLAHELRNPMAAIGAAGALLVRPGITPDKLNIAKEALKRRIDQLARLVDDLLDVSRITRGKIELKRENLNLEEAVSQAVEAARSYFEEREQKLVVRVADELPVFADPVRLEQIVTNLLTNASRYSDRGQEVALSAFREGGEAVIRVKDQGIGIPKEVLPGIFEPFIQAESTLARTRGGLGLGLTIVKRLCELHGGTVSAKSEGEGKGSEFEVRIPIGEGYSPMERPKETSAGALPLRILLVEDHPDTALMQSVMLESEGHSVEIAGEGHSAVRRAVEMKPDVILLDIGLPGLDGYEVAKRIREAGLEDTLIIALTGYGQERDISRAFQAGIDFHMLKPIDHGKLAVMLSQPRLKKSHAAFDA